MDILCYIQQKIPQVAARLYVTVCNMIQDIGEDFLNSFSNSFFLNGEYFENILITFGGEYVLLEFIFTKC